MVVLDSGDGEDVVDVGVAVCVSAVICLGVVVSTDEDP